MRDDLSQFSDDFIRSQKDYYSRSRRCGPSRDWNMITGLYQYYQSELIRRGLLKYNAIKGAYVECEPVAM